MLKFFFIALFLLSYFVERNAYSDSLPNYLKPAHKLIIQQWLMNNPDYLFAKDEDCRCEDDLDHYRHSKKWNKNFLVTLDYHPYYAVGDFNGDGQEDFAIAVKSRNKKTQDMVILVFNGPFKNTKDVTPNFILKKQLWIPDQGLFYYLSEYSKPRRLSFGYFESECCVLNPVGNTYEVDCSSGEE
jgi:hypothetical protein